MPIYAATIFLSAFLLFQVEPMIAKFIVPWFGGSASVWTVCLLFFQIALLLGYLYAHAVTRFLTGTVRRWLHLGLLGASLLALPVGPRGDAAPVIAGSPATQILLLLLTSVGLPFFLLSTTGPLLQAWLAAERAETRAGAYRLYALSNAGSLLALLGYPVLIEPHLTLHQQALAWSAGYVAFAALCAIVAWRQPASGPAEAVSEATASVPGTAPSWVLLLYWTMLSACASALLLAVTSHLSQNVAAIPFLWVLPLSAYLLSFILTFGGTRWAWRRSFLPLPALAIGAMAYALSDPLDNPGIETLVFVFVAGLFICCVVCHGELARTKPAPQHLTVFYLMISLGGALGGAFVALAAPVIFSTYLELPLGIAACALIALFALYRSRRRGWDAGWLFLAALTGVGFFLLAKAIKDVNQGYRLTERSFYGVLRVSDSDDTGESIRSLTNGTISHGEEFLSPARQMQPTTYYGPDSGIGLAIREAQARPGERVGVIGLGTGTIAAYGRPGDAYEFYEINPQVLDLARTQFHFLGGSRAAVTVTLGDARLSLARESPRQFDVLAVDAFASDSIPVHLLTREAFALYFRHLKPGGVLAVHVSNRYLDLQPVVAKAAQALGKQTRLIYTQEDDANDLNDTQWILVTSRPGYFDGPLFKGAAQPVETRFDLRLWTDDYSNLFQILHRE